MFENKPVDPKVVAAALAAFKTKSPTITPAPEYSPWKSGDYRCGFDHSRSKLWTAETGRLGFKVVFTVLDGDFAARRLYCDLWLVGGDDVLAITVRDLMKLGLAADDLNNPPAINGDFIVTVKVDSAGDVDVQRFVVA